MTYQTDLQAISNPRLSDVFAIANRYVPQEFKNRPWKNTLHGKAVYTEEAQLNCYVAAYWTMHQGKLNNAFSRFPFRALPETIDIIDWGCGQGIATIAFFEEIARLRISTLVHRVVLVEPSSLALERAVFNISQCCPSLSKHSLLPINSFLPNPDFFPSKLNEIATESPCVVHLFSNILDLSNIDLKKLAELSSRYGKQQFYLCVSPLCKGHENIDRFFDYFSHDVIRSLYQDKNPCIGQYGNKVYGGYTRLFLVQKSELLPTVRSYKYYAPVQMFASYTPDCLRDKSFDERETSFEVQAPFDFGLQKQQTLHPIFATLSNLISRGRNACASPYLEEKLVQIFGLTKKREEFGAFSYTSLRTLADYEQNMFHVIAVSVARIQKLIVEAILQERLSISQPKWRILVKEDIPCSAIALEDLSQMVTHIAKLSRDFSELSLPKIELFILPRYNPQNFLGANDAVYFPKDIASLSDISFDIAIDYSFGTPSSPQDPSLLEQVSVKNKCSFTLRASASLHSVRRFSTTERIVYKQITERNTEGLFSPLKENVEHLRYFLQLIFRKIDFREGQLPILNRALQLKNVIGLLPTGGGKSLTYQLAALLQPGIAIVIDPLLSLMKDQIDGLSRAGIDCCISINSKQTAKQKVIEEQRIVNAEALFTFVSPERLCINQFRQTLRAMHEADVFFSYGIIDEVHCVSEWGHDFRFSYLHLGRNLYTYVLPWQSSEESDETISLFGLTATASFDVLADVERELAGERSFAIDNETTIRFENTNRLELQYRVVKTEQGYNHFATKEAKRAALPEVLHELHHQFERLLTPTAIQRIKDRFLERENITSPDTIRQVQNTELVPHSPVTKEWYASPTSKSAAIIFCPHRQGSLGVNDSKNMKGVASTVEDFVEHPVSRYIGGDTFEAQDNFIANKSNIMVATKAFGMGIDKPNIRYTINVNHSGSLEAFVQEAGRAGRDRCMALATILYSGSLHGNGQSSSDYEVHNFFYQSNFMGEEHEKFIMYYLLSFLEVEQTSENGASFSCQGFLQDLLASPVGQKKSYTLSYNYPTESTNQLNESLVKRGLQPFSNPKMDIKLQQENYLSSLQKAIYRLCCISLVEDYTQDYVAKTFTLSCVRKADGGYYEVLGHFLERYYTVEKAKAQVRAAHSYRGQNEVHKCLGFLTDFIYSKIAVKRHQAILDMEQFCREAIRDSSDWLETNENLKDFIFFYFNSKYARKAYYAESGEAFSLVEDTEYGKIASPAILFKYMRVIDDELIGSGSQKDNIKHLQGAIRLIRRATTEPNPVLEFLNVFCLFFLKSVEKTPYLTEELEASFLKGYQSLYAATPDKELFYAIVKQFMEELTAHDRNLVSPEEIQELQNLQFLLELAYHTDVSKRILRQSTL